MAGQRVYVYTTIFGMPITGLRNLWEPSREYMGKPTEKPNYITSIVIPKTRGHWSEEPVLAGFTAACQELYSKAMTHIPFPQVVWPIKDGDVPEPGKNPVDWMKGRWFLNGSSSSPIKVDIVQGGQPVPLINRAGVKPGDIVTLSGALAVKQNDPRGVKFYANNVLFMGPGEEIAIGNGVTGAALMEQARAQGLNITGFTPGGGGFGGGQVGSGGFQPPPVVGGGFGGGFAPQGNPQGGFQPAPQGGFAPPPAQPPQFAAPQPGFAQAPQPGFAVQPQPGFAQAPQPGFQPVQGGFAPPAGVAPGGFVPPAGFGQPQG
jgi:hypothetical protein